MKQFTKRELLNMETIEQSWSGDELKIHENDIKVWLTNRENRQYDGDYTIEYLQTGCWKGQSFYFND